VLSDVRSVNWLDATLGGAEREGSIEQTARGAHDPRTLISPETVCTSIRPEDDPTWARSECFDCSSRITGRFVRMFPEVASAESRKLACGGTRMSTDPETVFNSHRRLAEGSPLTFTLPEMAWTFRSFAAPLISIASLAAEASTLSPGLLMR